MAKYCSIINNRVNLIARVKPSALSKLLESGAIMDITEENPDINNDWIYVDGVFSYSPAVPIVACNVTITADKTTIQANGVDKCTLTGVIKNSSDKIIDITKDIIVPMIRTDDLYTAIYDTIPRKISIVKGNFSLDFLTTTRGYYTLDKTKVTNLIENYTLNITSDIKLIAYI